MTHAINGRCDHCDDGQGQCLYPYYGMAPHRHDLSKTGSFIGSTVVDPKDSWPDNFVEDEPGAGCGVYTKCPVCGSSSEDCPMVACEMCLAPVEVAEALKCEMCGITICDACEAIDDSGASVCRECRERGSER